MALRADVEAWARLLRTARRLPRNTAVPAAQGLLWNVLSVVSEARDNWVESLPGDRSEEDKALIREVDVEADTWLGRILRRTTESKLTGSDGPTQPLSQTSESPGDGLDAGTELSGESTTVLNSESLDSPGGDLEMLEQELAGERTDDEELWWVDEPQEGSIPKDPETEKEKSEAGTSKELKGAESARCRPPKEAWKPPYPTLKRPGCWNCEKRGHKRAECPEPKVKTPCCFRCGWKGVRGVRSCPGCRECARGPDGDKNGDPRRL